VQIGREVQRAARVIKVVIFFKRRPAMALEAFQEHWRTRHAELVVRLPGIRRYVQNYPLASAYRSGEPAFDGVAESSFDDTQAMKALARTPEYAAVLADEPNFIDRTSMGSIITEERVLKDGAAPAGSAKYIAFVKREAGTPIDEFFRDWLERGALFARGAAVRRYAQCPTRRAVYDSGRTPAYDGVEMTWYDAPQPPGVATGFAAAERVVV
jgi:uncharacterized protein (TIGR02118 family)